MLFEITLFVFEIFFILFFELKFRFGFTRWFFLSWHDMKFSSLEKLFVKTSETRNSTLCIFIINICNTHCLSFASLSQWDFNFFDFSIFLKKLIQLIMSNIIWQIHYIQPMLLYISLVFFYLIINNFLFLFLFFNNLFIF